MEDLMSQRLPRKVSILGMDVKIKLEDLKKEHLQGNYKHLDRIIRIEKSLPLDEQWQVLFHEMGHALFIRGGVFFTQHISHEFEELIVEQYAQLMWDFYGR